jgi:hypothetical protein
MHSLHQNPKFNASRAPSKTPFNLYTRLITVRRQASHLIKERIKINLSAIADNAIELEP